MTQKFDMTIGGETVAADSYTEIRNPANTDEVVGQAPVGTKEHLDKAIAAARKAFESWRHSSEEERAEACQAIAKVVTVSTGNFQTGNLKCCRCFSWHARTLMLVGATRAMKRKQRTN